MPRSGDKVRVNWHGVGDWIPGEVAGENIDGTVRIVFEDGTVEYRVPCKRILECIRKVKKHGKPFWWVKHWHGVSRGVRRWVEAGTIFSQNLPGSREMYEAFLYFTGQSPPRQRSASYVHWSALSSHCGECGLWADIYVLESLHHVVARCHIRCGRNHTRAE